MMVITMTVVMKMLMNFYEDADALSHIFVTLGRLWKHQTKGLFAWTGVTMMTALFITMLQQDLLY